MGRLQDRVAIITGAARGQGAEEARLFVSEGAWVVLTDIGAEVPAFVSTLGDSARFIQHDVSDEKGWIQVVGAAVHEFGRLDILVNNAGVYRPASLRDTDLALWDLHYRVNQLGVFLGMRAVADFMSESGGGSIINISSNAGLRNFPGIFAYASSKWAVRGMSKLAASDLASAKIRVNSIHPGLIDTPMLDGNSPEQLEAFARMVPLQRLGTTAEVAELVLFLASDASSYITGAEICIDGGIG